MLQKVFQEFIVLQGDKFMKKKGSKQNLNGDTVVPFMINENIRGRFARIDGSLSKILKQHNYPFNVCCLIAEALLLTVMIGQAIKLRWKLSIQIRGHGNVKLIATDYYAPNTQKGIARIRAYAKFTKNSIVDLETDGIDLLGKGFFAVLIDQGQGTKPYQGITPLSGRSLSDCAKKYFEQSEQLPTTFKIFVGQSHRGRGKMSWYAGGIMLQNVAQEPKLGIETPKETLEACENFSHNLNDKITQKAESWDSTEILMNMVNEAELIGTGFPIDKILDRLFHTTRLSIFKRQIIEFGCQCSKDRVYSALSIYSGKDIQSMINNQGNVTADCQFCGRRYTLDPEKLGFENKK